MAITKGIPAAAVLANGINGRAFAAPVVAPDADETFAVPMTIADALGVGLSMKALALSGKVPEVTASIYERVGASLVTAARAEMQQRIAKAKESAGGAK